MSKEVLLEENAQRFVLFPLQYHSVFDFYKKHIQSFWTTDEIDLSRDTGDWTNKLTADDQHFIKTVLAFFAASDGIVMENLALRFYSEVQIPEVRQFYAVQIAMEAIHSETYSLLIDTYIKDEDEKQLLFDAIQNVPTIKRKAEWAKKWINSDSAQDHFGVRLIAFAIVEGVFFSASFCAIFWLKKRGLMPGLTFSNELIARDEGLHTDFACHLYTTLWKQKLPQEQVHLIMKEAVEIECDFVNSALHVDLIGMNSAMMQQYVKFVADRLLIVLGYAKVYNVANSCDFMDMINLDSKSNFFEKRVSAYKRDSTVRDTTRNPFDFNAPF